MQTHTPNRPEPQPMSQALILWGALLMSQAMIVIVSQTAMTRPPEAPDLNQPAASAVGHLPDWYFMVGALGALVLSFVIPKILSKNAKPAFDQQGQVTRESMQKILPTWIIRWALLETVTLFGFLNSMLSSRPTAIYPYAGAALIGFLLAFPSESKLRAL